MWFSLNNSVQKNLNRNFYIRPMMNYRLSENSYIILNYNFNSYNNERTSNSIRESSNLIPAIKYSSAFDNPEATRNNEFVLKYKTMLDTLGRSLQVTGYYSNYHKVPRRNPHKIFPLMAVWHQCKQSEPEPCLWKSRLLSFSK